MINIIVGLPGSGKTYVLTKKALQYVEKGYKIYTNYPLNLTKESPFYPYKKKIHFWHTIEDLIKIENGIILMDEAQIFFNSRAWADLDPRMQYKLQQHRKDGLDIWGTVQSETRLDSVMRELVSYYYKCGKMFGSKEFSKHPYGLIRVFAYFPEDIQKVQARHRFSEWHWISKRGCLAYDTEAKIEFENFERPLRHIEYKCAECGEAKVVHKQ